MNRPSMRINGCFSHFCFPSHSESYHRKSIVSAAAEFFSHLDFNLEGSVKYHFLSKSHVPAVHLKKWSQLSSGLNTEKTTFRTLDLQFI